MNTVVNEALYGLLRMAMSPSSSKASFSQKLSEREWDRLHEEALKQLLAGILYPAICKLPPELRPPMDLVFQWASEAETIKGHNRLINAEAARLTELFAKHGRKTAVLKGPANARLYPEPNLRQAGDIDLWVEGGKDSVLALLQGMGYEIDKKDFLAPHHVDLRPVESGISVEIHYKPSSGNLNPVSNARLQRFLERAIQHVEPVAEGFNVPSTKFALVMQLSHIQRHLLDEGIGFKQIVDYFVLLLHASEAERAEVSDNLVEFGLQHTAGALMWVLEYILGLEQSKMLCKPDRRRGKRMLVEIEECGNFGYGKADPSEQFIVRWLKNRLRMVGLFWFAPSEVFFHELSYWKVFVKSIPLRVRLRKVSIWDEFH